MDALSMRTVRGCPANSMPSGAITSNIVSSPTTADTIARAISEMSTGVDLLLCTGGLGPTPDDVSREGLAQAMGEELHEDVDAAKALCARFEASGRTPGPGNLRKRFDPRVRR